MRDHFPTDELAGQQHFDLRQWRRRLEDPQSAVVQILASDEPFPRLVEGRQRVRRRLEQPHGRVAAAERMERVAEIGDGRVVRIQQAALGEQRVHERVAQRAFDRLTKLRPGHQDGVDVDAVRRQGDVRGRHPFVINRDEHEVDIGLFPDRVMRQAAAEDGGQHGVVFADLTDKDVERFGEATFDGLQVHGPSMIRHGADQTVFSGQRCFG